MVLEADKFSASQATPIFFEGERQKTALDEAQELIALRGDHNQRFTGLHFNRDFSSNTAIVWLPGMFEDVTSIDLRYMGYQLAAANPENPILLINLPGHGQSDPLTPAQRSEIIKTKQLILVGSSQASAARERLGDAGAIVAAGKSAGARLLPHFVVKAGELDMDPLAMIGFSMVGLDKRPSAAMTLAFLLDGYLLQYKYHQGAANQVLDKAMDVSFKSMMSKVGFRDTHNALVNNARIFRDDPSYRAFLLARSPLADDGGFEAIEQAMDLNTDMHAALVSGGLDKVSRWRKIEPGAQRLVDAYHGRLSWDMWPNDGHAVGIGTQTPRFAKAINYVIESLTA